MRSIGARIAVAVVAAGVVTGLASPAWAQAPGWGRPASVTSQISFSFAGYQSATSAPSDTVDTTFTVPTVTCTEHGQALSDSLFLGPAVSDNLGRADAVYVETYCSNGSVLYAVVDTLGGTSTDLPPFAGIQAGDVVEASVTDSNSGGSVSITDVRLSETDTASGAGVSPLYADIGNDDQSPPPFSGLSFSSTTVNGSGLASLTLVRYFEDYRRDKTNYREITPKGVIGGGFTLNSVGYYP